VCCCVRSATEVTVHWDYVGAMLKHLNQFSSLVSSCANIQTTTPGFCSLFKCSNIASSVCSKMVMHSQSSSRPGLRSVDTAHCAKPSIRTEFREHVFHSAGPAAWNNLPDHLHDITDIVSK